MYHEIAHSPTLKRSAVTKPPSHTSRHASWRSGSHLKSMENNRASTTSETAKFKRARTTLSAAEPLNQAEKEASAALRINETASRKPSARMPAKDIA